MKYIKLAKPIPPGEVIQDYMDGWGWMQEDLARIMGRPLKTVNALLQGTKQITTTTAKELAGAFDTSEEMWLNLETAYRLDLDEESVEAVPIRRELFKRAPVRELERRSWLPKTGSDQELKVALDEFESYEVPERLAARTSLREGPGLTTEQRAWCRMAAKAAQMHTVSDYKGGISNSDFAALRLLAAHPEGARLVPRTLAKIGIRFVVVEHLAKTRIDGMAFWLNEKSPAIALSIRYDRIDNFWFTLFHEAIHIQNRDETILDVDVGSAQTDDSPEEQRANREASELLVPERELSSFLVRYGNRISKERIIQFSHRMKIHPGIVVGQLHHVRPNSYGKFRKMLVGIRDIVTEEAITDGWGRSIKT